MANNLDNYIFFTICEKSLEIYKEQRVYNVTYNSFCNIFRCALETQDLTKWQTSFIFKLNIYLNKIYGFDKAKSADYIARFFIDEKYFLFEEPTKFMMYYFRHSYC